MSDIWIKVTPGIGSLIRLDSIRKISIDGTNVILYHNNDDKTTNFEWSSEDKSIVFMRTLEELIRQHGTLIEFN